MVSKLTVHFVGPVRRPGPERAAEVDREGLRTVGDLLDRLGYSQAEREALHVLVDGTRRPVDAVLADAASVEILVAIGGG
jgi:sulfur carrier protein ThiS